MEHSWDDHNLCFTKDLDFGGPDFMNTWQLVILLAKGFHLQTRLGHNVNIKSSTS